MARGNAIFAYALLLSTWPRGASIGASAPSLDTWAEESESPRPAANSEPGLWAGLCAHTDAALDAVAGELAVGRFAASDGDALRLSLRRAGEPHDRPRALLLSGAHIAKNFLLTRVTSWLADLPHAGDLRCGVAWSRSSAHDDALALVAVDAEADLSPLPTYVPAQTWVDIRARVLVPATTAKVLIAGQTGRPAAVPTSFSGGEVRARAYLDRQGPWLVQVIASGQRGPRPILEAYVFAGTPPSSRALVMQAPGEDEARGGDPADRLVNMLNSARSSERLLPLLRSPELDRVAEQHSRRMIAASDLAHDAGDGDPRERALAAGIDFRELGENVAHAATLALAHRALFRSPSHRANMLESRYARVGAAVLASRDGTVWVTEMFAR